MLIYASAYIDDAVDFPARALSRARPLNQAIGCRTPSPEKVCRQSKFVSCSGQNPVTAFSPWRLNLPPPPPFVCIFFERFLVGSRSVPSPRISYIKDIVFLLAGYRPSFPIPYCTSLQFHTAVVVVVPPPEVVCLLPVVRVFSGIANFQIWKSILVEGEHVGLGHNQLPCCAACLCLLVVASVHFGFAAFV